MLRRESVHPGAISLPDRPRAEQIRLFERALDFIEAHDPPLDMVNQALILSEDGTITRMDLP